VPPPAIPAGGKVDDSKPTVLPDIPAPDAKPPAPAAPPSLPAIPAPDAAAAPPAIPAAPPAPSGPAAPAVPAIPPADAGKPTDAKPADAKPTAPVVPPPVPILPPPAVLPGGVPPAIPAVPPPADVTPPPPLTKSPESAQPAGPAKTDSRLQNGNTGTSVKTDKPAASPGVAPAVPIVPPTIPAVDPPKPSLPPLPAVPAVGVPGEIPGTTVDRARPVDPPQRNAEKPVAPVPAPNDPFKPIPVPTPGDVSVSTLHHSVAAAVIGGFLFTPAAPARAVPPLPAVPVPGAIAADDKTDVGDLKKQVEEGNKKLGDIQRDLKTLTELLNGRRDKDGFPLTSDPGLVAEMRALKDKLSKVEQDLNALKTQSSSLRPATPAGPIVEPPKTVAKAIVRVVNEYPVQISIVVNGTSYRVPPTKSLDVEVPAGEFTYQLLESGAAATKSMIKEKETVTLRIK